MLFRGRPTVSRKGIAFDYSSPAELCCRGAEDGTLITGVLRQQSEAISYAVDELRAHRSLSAWMQVGEERFSKDEIHRLLGRCRLSAG